MTKNSNKKIFFVTLMTSLMLVLAGCGIKTPLTEKQLTKEFNNNTISLLSVKRIADAKAQAKGKKNTKAFIKVFNKNAKKEQTKVEKSLETLQDGQKFSGYPADVQNYSRNALAYIKTVTTDKSSKQQKKAYHKATQAALKVASDNSNKTTKNYVTSIVQNDTVLQAKPQIVKSKSAKTKKKSSSKTKNDKNKITIDSKGNVALKNQKKLKTHIVNINLSWGIVLILISGLLIATVFLQPNKSEDMTKALSDEKSMPRPRGYALFVVRSTEVLTAILAVLLIILNHIN